MSTATASAVITFVAGLVNDPANATFSQDQIYAALMRHAWEARYIPLTALWTYAAGGTGSRLTFDAPSEDWAYWENDAALVDGGYNAVTPDTSDYTRGRWTFTSEPSSLPVSLSGLSHDPYAAAADLLEMRAAQLAEEVESFTSLSGSVAFANKRSGPLELARTYRAKARRNDAMTRIVRQDLTGDSAGLS